MDEIQNKFHNLLNSYLKDNPGTGTERMLAKKFDTSIPTIRRWTERKTSPHPAMCPRLIATLKNITQAGL